MHRSTFARGMHRSTFAPVQKWTCACHLALHWIDSAEVTVYQTVTYEQLNLADDDSMDDLESSEARTMTT